MTFCSTCGYDVVVCQCDESFDLEEEAYDEDSWCQHCQGQGRIPAPDYLAILGKSYVACEHCEAGLQWLAFC